MYTQNNQTIDNIQSKIQMYEQKKAQLDEEIKNLERELIVTEQQKKTIEETLMSNFNTTDITVLDKISQSYDSEIIKLEEEILIAENSLINNQ